MQKALTFSKLAQLTRSSLGSIHKRQMFWWGHDTLEDKAQRKAKAQHNEVIKWTNPELGVEAKTRYLYAPARIMDEASILAQPSFLDYNMPNYFNYVRQPFITKLKDYPFWAHKKQMNIYQDLVNDQIFLRERVVALGPDLTAAQFLLNRNCRVRRHRERFCISFAT